MIALQSVKLTVEQKTEIDVALKRTLAAEVSQQTLQGFLVNLQEQELQQALQNYTSEGSMRLLDGEVDTLTLSNFNVFELSEIMSLGDANVLPILDYLFYRIERQLNSSHPTLVVLDEAWMMLKHQEFSAAIEKWLRTFRKKNATVIILTQNINDLFTGTSENLLTSIQNFIFLPNEQIKTPKQLELHEKIGLNEVDIETIFHGVPKRDYFLLSEQIDRKSFSLNLGPVALAFCSDRLVKELPRLEKQYGQAWQEAWLSELGITHSNLERRQ